MGISGFPFAIQHYISEPTARWANYKTAWMRCFRQIDDGKSGGLRKVTVQATVSPDVLNRAYHLIGDCIDKIGFAQAASEYFFWAWNKKSGVRGFRNSAKFVHCRYHLYNFGFHIKAFLDSLSVFTNKELNLGFKGSNVDITKEKFRRAISARDPDLGVVVETFVEWFSEVAGWRQRLIHWHGVPLLLSKDLEPALPQDPDMSVYRFSQVRSAEEWSSIPLISVADLFQRWLQTADSLYDAVLGRVPERWVP